MGTSTWISFRLFGRVQESFLIHVVPSGESPNASLLASLPPRQSPEDKSAGSLTVILIERPDPRETCSTVFSQSWRVSFMHVTENTLTVSGDVPLTVSPGFFFFFFYVLTLPFRSPLECFCTDCSRTTATGLPLLYMSPNIAPAGFSFWPDYRRVSAPLTLFSLSWEEYPHR